MAIIALAACSSTGSDESDALRGVSEVSASSLCESYFATARTLTATRNTFDLDGMEAAAEGYERLAADARTSGARKFASMATDAADATRALVKFARRPEPSGRTESASGTGSSFAPLMALALKAQLPDNHLALACYSSGYVPVGS